MIKRGKEWSWMNKLDYSNHYYNEGKEILKKDTEKDWCHYSGMPSPNAYKETNMERKKRKRKRTLKVKIIRFFQEETVIDWLVFLTFIGTFFLLTYLSTKT
jgi:hypothetical protein